MTKKISFLLVSILLLVTLNSAISDTISTPSEPPEGIKVISAIEAKELIEEKSAYHFDTRQELNFSNGHLPGAISLPLKWTKKGMPADREGKFNLSKLPSNKKSKIIFHSSGPDGWKAYFAAVNAKKAGYENIMWFRGGLSDWVKQGYSIEK